MLKLSDSTSIKADVKVAGNVAHALLYNGTSPQLVSADYNNGTGKYQPWALRGNGGVYPSAE